MDSQTVFVALSDAMAGLYLEEQSSRVIVDDVRIDASQIIFSARAQTNWHSILAEAIRQQHLDPHSCHV